MRSYLAATTIVTTTTARPCRYYDPQIPTDEYGVKETEPIGWLAAAMQQQNSEMPAVAMQEAVRIKDSISFMCTVVLFDEEIEE